MRGLAWLGTYLKFQASTGYNRPLLWADFFSFHSPSLRILTGWFTAIWPSALGVYGVLRTADA